MTREEKMTSEEKKAVKRGRVSPFILSTSLFIRDYLLERGEGYPQEIWRCLKKKKKEKGLYFGSYQSFWINYFRNLLKLGLVEEVRREPSKRSKLKERIYFRIKPGFEKDPRWINPQNAVWGTKKLYKDWKRRVKKVE